MDTGEGHIEINPSGSWIRAQSTDEGIAQLEQVFSSQQQRVLVHAVDFCVVLPPVSTKRLKKLQSSHEAAKNNIAFTRAVTSLFWILYRNSGEPGEFAGGISLFLTVKSTTDELIDELVETGELVSDHIELAEPIWEIRNQFKYLELGQNLLSTNPLQTLGCVSEFQFDGGPARRRFHPSAIGTLCSKMPAVQKLELEFSLPSRRLMDERREVRSALARVLRETTFSQGLEDLTLSLDDDDPKNEGSDPGSFLEAEGGEDDLSLGVRQICRLPGLRKLDLSGLWVLSPAAFGPHPRLPEIHCRALEYLHIHCATTTPDGKYLNTGDPEDRVVDADDEGRDELYGYDDPAAGAPFDSDDSDTSDYQPDFEWARQAGDFPGAWYRCTPDPATFEPLARSFAAAASSPASMPALRRMRIVFGGHSGTTRAPLEMEYSRGWKGNGEAEDDEGGRSSFEEEDAGCPEWYLFGARDFDPSWRIPEGLKSVMKGPEGNGKIHLVIQHERIPV